MKPSCLVLLLAVLSHTATAQNPNYRYTLYMKLHSIKADKVVEGPFDNEEDLYGTIRGEAKGAGVEGDNIVVVRKELRDFKVGRNDIFLDQEQLIGRRLTMDQIGTIKVRIGGEMKDREPAAYFSYRMTNANEIDRSFNHEYRGFLLKDISSFMNALKTMPPSSTIQAVKFGSDTLAEAEFLEEAGPLNRDNQSKITVYWQFRVIVSAN